MTNNEKLKEVIKDYKNDFISKQWDRIGKKIMDFRDTGDYDEETYYSNFAVLN